MLRDTPNNESIIIEYGFVDSTKDDVEQIKNNYEKYAEAVVRAVADYKGIPYISNSNDTYVVKKGDTLCIIEAMKLMNEIESEFTGKITEVLVNDGDVVEYGTPLFKIIV